MVLNLILIILILAGVGYVAYRYTNSLSDVRDDDMDENDYTDIDTLRDKITREFSSMLKDNIRDRNLNKKEYEKRKKSKSEFRKNLKRSASGDHQAKHFVKMYIKNMLLDPSMHLGVNESSIDFIIPFGRANELKPEDKFKIMLYIAYNYLTDENGETLKQNGFSTLIKKFDILKPIEIPETGDMIYDFTRQKLDEIFAYLNGHYSLSYNDKLEILSQRIFEDYKGFGIVDMLFDTGIDEVAVGLSGVSKDGYEIMNAKNLRYTYQSIWIMVGGVKLRMSCVQLKSQEELVRITSNIYKYGANRILSRKSGYVISTMRNGARVVVARPPFVNTYFFISRKFDSAPSLAPENIIKGNNNLIALTMIKWLIKGQRTIAITGAQGSGKTVTLKSLVRYIDARLSLRVQEISAELNLNYAYPYRNIISMQETESIGSQEGLNFQKKTSGDVNIIGEVAEAIQANFVIQTSMVASLFTMFTHHAKTTYDLVLSFANNLLDPVVGIYRDKKEAVEMSAKILNIDLHMENKKGHRYLERITEVVPLTNVKYPSDRKAAATHEEDEKEYWKRQTDRELFECRDLVRFENGEFVFVQLPSDEMLNDIKSKLTAAEEQQFVADMNMIQAIKRNPYQGDFFGDLPDPVEELLPDEAQVS